MNVSVPRCGSLQFMAKDVCERLGIGYVEQPEYCLRTVELGVSVSPDSLCFPMKVMVGNAIEALESGADTLVMAAGGNACRYNYFADILRRILEREGFRFTMVVFDAPGDSLADFYRNCRVLTRDTDAHVPGMVRAMALAVRKGWAYDEIRKYSIALRALERMQGEVDRVAGESLAMLEDSRSRDEIEDCRRAIRDMFANVPVDERRPHVTVGIVGDIMTSVEPYFNFDIERWLSDRGAVAERPLYMSDLLNPSPRKRVCGRDDRDIASSAAPYLCHEIGGHGQINVAAAADYARRGFDAVVHFYAFTCLPEVIAKTVFTRISDEMGMPILSISVDEQTGRAGIQTRLEAFIDLVWSRKERAAEPARLRA